MELSGELWDLLNQVENLHDHIAQQLRTAQDQQVKDQLKKIRELLQRHLSGVTIRSLYDTVTVILWNRGRSLFNGIAEYKKFIGDQGKEDVKEKAEAAKKTIEDMAKSFKEDISRLKGIVVKLQQGASTLKQNLQSLQSSDQKQEIASVIQQAVSAIDNIFNPKINSILKKLNDLENIPEQIKQEAEQLSLQGRPSDAEESIGDSASTSPEQEPPKQVFELEDKIMDLYRAVVALEILVNTAIENAGIIPKQFVGIDTYTVSQGLRSINYKHLDAALKFLEKYTNTSRPSLLAALSSAKQGNATQPHFLKQQQAASSYDIPEGIKIYLENFKTFLVDVRNRVRANLDDILREVSELGNNIGQISEIEEKLQAQKVCSIPTFIILGTCASKLDDELPPSIVEAAGPVLGAIIIAQSIWSSLLREDGWAEQVLQEITPQFQEPGIRWGLYNRFLRGGLRNILQDPKIQADLRNMFQDPKKQEGLHNILVVLAHRRQEARGETPPRVAEEVGATVLGAIGAFVQPAVKQLRQGAPSRKGKKLRRVLLITNTTLIRDVANEAAEEKEIPTLTEGGIVKNTKEMINALVKFMRKYWESIMNRINDDIKAGRFSNPGDINKAIEEVHESWQALIKKLAEAGWREEYSYDATREMKKIGGIKTELEKLLNAWFNLFEKWKAAGPKLNKGALNLEYLLFHPLGLPALRIALTTLSTSTPEVATPEEVTQTVKEPEKKGRHETGGGPQTGEGPKKGEGPKTRDKETTEKTLQDEIRRAINFIEKRQVDDAIKAVANAITILRDIDKQKTQARGAPLTHLQEAASCLSVALRRLRDAGQLEPDSDGFNANLSQANSLLQEALKVLSNPTAGRTPYLGRKLLLLMKTLSTTPTTARSHRQRVKNEDILEKETI
jgi:hypothetical protein